MRLRTKLLAGVAAGAAAAGVALVAPAGAAETHSFSICKESPSSQVWVTVAGRLDSRWLNPGECDDGGQFETGTNYYVPVRPNDANSRALANESWAPGQDTHLAVHGTPRSPSYDFSVS